MEHLNAEIVLLTVTDISLAIDWLKNSYLYVRVKKVRLSSQGMKQVPLKLSMMLWARFAGRCY